MAEQAEFADHLTLPEPAVHGSEGWDDPIPVESFQTMPFAAAPGQIVGKVLKLDAARAFNLEEAFLLREGQHRKVRTGEVVVIFMEMNGVKPEGVAFLALEPTYITGPAVYLVADNECAMEHPKYALTFQQERCENSIRENSLGYALPLATLVVAALCMNRYADIGLLAFILTTLAVFISILWGCRSLSGYAARSRVDWIERYYDKAIRNGVTFSVPKSMGGSVKAEQVEE